MRKIVAIFVILACLVLQQMLTQSVEVPAIAATGANSSEVTELQQKQLQIEQYRANILKAREKIEQQEQAARDRLNNLQGQISQTSDQIAAQENKLQEATAKLQKIESELATAEASYGKQQTSTIARLRFLQQQGNAPTWTVLLQSRSLQEAMDRQYQLKQVYAADNQALVALKATKQQIQAKKLEAEQQRNQIALLTGQLMAQKSSFEDRAQTEATLVTRLNNNREALAAAEQQLADESARITQDIQQRLAASIAFPGTVFLRGTGKLAIPTSGPITSTFGWRVHPVLGTSRMHNGLDFGADYGTLIQAADNGVVISAGWNGGYGNCVIIDHGNGLTTLYGHASQLYVTVGQAVTRGQPIAAVGSTGLSTGPHLHFEVRREGEPIDPMIFLA